MPDQTWTLRLTPPGRPATTRTGLAKDEMLDILTALMDGDTRAYAPDARREESVAA